MKQTDRVHTGVIQEITRDHIKFKPVGESYGNQVRNARIDYLATPHVVLIRDGILLPPFLAEIPVDASETEPVSHQSNRQIVALESMARSLQIMAAIEIGMVGLIVIGAVVAGAQ